MSYNYNFIDFFNCTSKYKCIKSRPGIYEKIVACPCIAFAHEESPTEIWFHHDPRYQTHNHPADDLAQDDADLMDEFRKQSMKRTSTCAVIWGKLAKLVNFYLKLNIFLKNLTYIYIYI